MRMEIPDAILLLTYCLRFYHKYFAFKYLPIKKKSITC